MVITVEEFRKNLRTKLSKELVQEILTKYENFSFAHDETNNGNKLGEIDKISKENAGSISRENFADFLNNELKDDYLISRGAYIKAYAAENDEQIKIIRQISEIMKASMYSRPDTITLTSDCLLNHPQNDEAVHLLTLNVPAESLLSVARALYEDFKKYGISFDMEIPKFTIAGKGFTEAIRLHVATLDFEDTLYAINRLDKVYKDKIKAPNIFNANVNDLVGYDSLIDINGKRASSELGVAVIKGLDKTLLELSKEDTFDDMSSADYLKNAENKDLARQRILQKVKDNNPGFIDSVYSAIKSTIEEEKMAIDIDNVYASDLAQSELNVEFNTIDYEEEKEDTKDRLKITDKIQATASQFKSGIDALKALTNESAIQAAISFGSTFEQDTEEKTKALNSADSLKTDNPTVTVIPKQDKIELNDYKEQVFDKIDEDAKPVVTADDALTETQTVASPADTLLPGEEAFITPVAAPAPTASPIVVNDSVVKTDEPQEITIENENTIQMAEPSVDATPVETPVDKPKSVKEMVDHLATLDLGLNKPVAPVAPVAPEMQTQNVVSEPATLLPGEITPVQVNTLPGEMPVFTPDGIMSQPAITIPEKEDNALDELKNGLAAIGLKYEDTKPAETPTQIIQEPSNDEKDEVDDINNHLNNSNQALNETVNTQTEVLTPKEESNITEEKTSSTTETNDTGIKEVITPNPESTNVFDNPQAPVQTELIEPKEELSMEQILEGGTEEPAYVGEPTKQEEVKIASEQGVTVEDDGKIEVKDSKEETVVPEPTFEPVETVPPVVTDDKVAQAMEKTQILTPVKENETTKIVNELSEKVDDKTIELQLPEEDKDLYDQINKELDATPSSLKLTSKEAISLLVNKPQDLALIGKYNYLGLEPEAFRTIIQDEYGNPVPKDDGSPKTFLDYLEENQEDLAKINFNEKIYLRGEDGAYMDGKTFARERLFDNAVHGYRSVATIIENYIEQPGKKKIFGLF